MGSLLVLVVAAVLFAAALWVVVYRIVGRASDNLFDWIVDTFGKERRD